MGQAQSLIPVFLGWDKEELSLRPVWAKSKRGYLKNNLK
jgi:hypothetical protein